MKPEEEKLADLVQAGCMISDEIMGGVRSLPIHAELIEGEGGPALYWVEANAEHQGQTHVREYDAATVMHGRDLDLTANGRPVAYVAPFTEWPQENTDDLNERLATARADLQADGAQASFDAFVDATRPK